MRATLARVLRSIADRLANNPQVEIQIAESIVRGCGPVHDAITAKFNLQSKAVR